MQPQPDTVVLIPVFDNQAGLDHSLASLERCAGEFHVIVVDDGSSPAIRLNTRLGETTLLRLEHNGGISRALNRGMLRASKLGFHFIARLDAGDTVHPQRIVRQREFLATHPECLLVSSWVDFVDTEARPLFRHRAPSGERALRRRMRLNNWLIHPAVMFRASVIRTVGYYCGRARVSEDYEYFLRILDRGPAAVIPEVLTTCEYNYRGITVTRRREQQRERLRLQLRFFDCRSLSSYAGVARTMLSLLAPHGALVRYKQLLWRGVS